MNNPFDERLRTHKLKGKFADFYAFWINYEYRVMFKFMDGDEVQFYKVGTYHIYT